MTNSDIRIVDGAFITLSDGVRLASRIWLPADADRHPVPAILEYLPYRYQDGTAQRDALMHPWFARHGYASVRVDMRGTGNSEGVLLGEYLLQEQDDGLEIIDWVARQNWCCGEIGIIGISWGGFNGLQIAARRPPALKAIVTVCSTDDRFVDDTHYKGGAMLCDNIAWSGFMFSINTTPPDPLLHGDGWEQIWQRRLAETGHWLVDWLEHQHRDDFYRHGSICENYDDIECAVYAVGGWADGYTNAVFRLLANLSAPCKGLIGPWAHQYPHFATPGPAIGFLQECLSWWDHWLKGIDNGIMDEPALRCWMQDSALPDVCPDQRPGRWIAESCWPAADLRPTNFHLNSDGLSRQAGPAGPMKITSPETTGQAAGLWCAYGRDPDQPADQRIDAGGALLFETGPLKDGLEILGRPVVRLRASCNRTGGNVAVVLNEVFPDGQSARISFGVLNLAHRNDHRDPEPLVPGEICEFLIRLDAIAHAFSVGNRICLAVSTAYWPTIWPSPEKTALTVIASDSTLELPARPARSGDRSLREFPGPELPAPLDVMVEREAGSRFSVTRNIGTGRLVRHNAVDEGRIVFGDHEGWAVESTHDETYSIHPEDPNSACCDIVWTERFSRGEWNVSTRTSTVVTSTPMNFELEARLEAWNDDRLVHEQCWQRSIARKLV